MRNSTYFLLTATFIIVSIVALIIAVVYDGMDNSDRSIVFGCVACACAVPAFSSATILLKSADDKEESNDETKAEEKTSVEENDG